MEIGNKLKFEIHYKKLLKRASMVASVEYNMRAIFNSNQLYQVPKPYIQAFFNA